MNKQERKIYRFIPLQVNQFQFVKADSPEQALEVAREYYKNNFQVEEYWFELSEETIAQLVLDADKFLKG